jgi:hypothetical protein
MSVQSSLCKALGISGIAMLTAISAGAVPLTYNVVVSESDIKTYMNAGVNVDLNPDLLNQFPQFGYLTGTSVTQPTTASRAIADVGLPGGFGGGANGITISELKWQTLLAPGQMDGFGAITVPLDLTGTNIQFVAYTAKVASLQLTLDDPVTSTLTPTLNPGEWAWSGLANVTISGVIAPIVEIPTQPTIQLGPFPFSQALTMPLAGTFSGDATGSELTLGIPLGTLQNQSLALPPINVPIDGLGGLIPVTGYFQMNSLVLADISTAIVYRNATPIPEPATALLMVLGLAGLAAVRRH